MTTLTGVLDNIRGGAAKTKAERLLREVIQGVLDSGKDGEVSLKLKIKRDKHDENAVGVYPSVTAKVPEKVLAEGIFYVDEHFNLTREDPKQLELLKEQEQERERENQKHLDRLTAGGIARLEPRTGTDD